AMAGPPLPPVETGGRERERHARRPPLSQLFLIQGRGIRGVDLTAELFEYPADESRRCDAIGMDGQAVAGRCCHDPDTEPQWIRSRRGGAHNIAVSAPRMRRGVR